MVHITATIHEPLYPWLELQGIVPPFDVLWPITDTDIVWPPRFFIRDADADILARSLYNDLIQSSRVIWAD
jgi:hypothetical protein